MHVRDRRITILRSLRERGFQSVQQLEQLLGVSAATVRRDLTDLEREELLCRVHGGAETSRDALPSRLSGQPAFFAAQGRRLMEKRAIAERAAELIPADSSIIVDGGTTTFALVEFLRDRELRVLTSSFPLANELLQRTQAQVTVPGGPVYRDQQLILSPFDEPVIQGYVASLIFMGVQGVSERGLLQSDPMLVQAQRQLLDRADRLVVLADSTKFAPAGNLVVCPLERIDVFVTDAGASPASLAWLRDAGVEVLVVNKHRLRRNRARKTRTSLGSAAFEASERP